MQGTWVRSGQIPHVSEQPSQGAVTTDPTWWKHRSPRVLEPGLCSTRSHRDEAPTHTAASAHPPLPVTLRKAHPQARLGASGDQWPLKNPPNIRAAWSPSLQLLGSLLTPWSPLSSLGPYGNNKAFCSKKKEKERERKARTATKAPCSQYTYRPVLLKPHSCLPWRFYQFTASGDKEGIGSLAFH